MTSATVGCNGIIKKAGANKIKGKNKPALKRRGNQQGRFWRPKGNMENPPRRVKRLRRTVENKWGEK